MRKVKVLIGGTAHDDAEALVEAWHRAERGEDVADYAIAFQSWESLAAVLTNERLRLLRHVHGHPAPSVMALAKALGRQYRRVHEDVSILTEAGLLDRSDGGVRATADRIEATIELGQGQAA